MKVIFPNSASISVRERLVLRHGRRDKLCLKVRYGVLLHPDVGPVLIDTGYTPETTTAPGRSLAMRIYGRALGPELHDTAQPAAVLAALGYRPEDVRHIIVTHFHADHVSGLAQFPEARIHADGPAAQKVLSRGPLANLRHGVFSETLPSDLARRLVPFDTAPEATPEGLPPGRDLFGDGRVVAVALPGHADGHVGLFLVSDEGPLFYGVDVQWMLRAVTEDRAPGFPARLIADDGSAARTSTKTLAGIAATGLDVVLCHDPEPSPFDWTPQ